MEYTPRTPAFRTQKTTSAKVKTRPEEPVAHIESAPLCSPSELTQQQQMRTQVSSVPLILYTFKPDSITLQVLSSMFPDRYEDQSVAQGKTNWLDFVATMANLGLSAEH